MSWLTRLRNAAAPAALHRDLTEEQRFHLEAKAADLARAGESDAEAHRHARAHFGEPEHWRDHSQAAKSSRWLGDGLADLRYALRLLRRQPGFALAATLSLALGLGASAAVFSVVNGTLLRPLPYPQADRLTYIWHLTPPAVALGSDVIPWDRVAARDIAAMPAFASVGAFKPGAMNLTGFAQPERLDTVFASAGLFQALAVKPELGRAYTAREDQPNRGHVVLISDQVWRGELHADPHALGRILSLDGQPYAIVGVMPPGFDFPSGATQPAIFAFASRPQIWVPLAAPPGPMARGESSELALLARLRDGAGIAQAQGELDAYRRQLEAQTPAARGWYTALAQPIAVQATGALRGPLWLLLAAVGLVLLVACSNVAGLLLARSLSRRREFALRAVLGAGAGRLARQVLAEALTLALGGAIAGAAIAWALLAALRDWAPATLPQLRAAVLDWRVLAFGAAATLCSAVLSALAPMWTLARRSNAAASLGSGWRSRTGLGSQQMRNAMVAGQIALALVLAVSGALLARSLYATLAAGGGFAPAHAVTFGVSLPPLRYPDSATQSRFLEAARARVSALPEVAAAGFGEVAPLDGATESTGLIIPGRPRDPRKPIIANYTVASAGFFQAAGIPLLRGRVFNDDDVAASLPVAVVNQAFEANFFPGQSAVGQQIHVPIEREPRLIVGVVANLKHDRIGEAATPEMFSPSTQGPWPSMLAMQLLVRLRPAPDGAMPQAFAQHVASAIHAVDPEAAVASPQTLQRLIADSVAPARFAVLLLAAFALLALALAVIGLYGVVALVAQQRRGEFSLRLALGASRASLFGLVLRQGARPAAAGIAAGLLLAAASGQFLRRYLFGVAALDPFAVTAATLLLAAIALAACLLPARRAARVDPIAALRED
ncbi:MAG TPA: ADOP family duplicated permease [Terriglobales bacterium]|nr:ADOP family duplicated permease [Terriglobales bacterium]